MTETTLEQSTMLKLHDLKIMEPEEGRNFMIGFDEKCSKKQSEAYSFAIEQVLEEASLSYVYHEVEGMQFWEVNKETTKEHLERLMQSIHIVASDYDAEIRELGINL